MGWIVDWMGLAEGVAADASGKLTIVGLAPTHFAIDSFPAQMNLAFILVAHLDESEVPDDMGDTKVRSRLQGQGPDGTTLFLMENVAPLITVKGRQRVPARFQAVSSLGLNIPKPGRYTLSGTFTILRDEHPSDAMVGEASFLILDSSSELR